MKHFTGYGAYRLFLALRTHFINDKYDFHASHGKTSASKDSYSKRTDKALFDKVARDYSPTDLKGLFISNLLNDRHYIAEFIDEQAELVHTDYTRRRQSLSYVCANDLDRIFSQNNPRVPFATSKDRYPSIVMLFLRGVIAPESLVILDDFTGFTKKFDKYYEDDIIWPKISRKIRKYRPFVKYDKAKMKKIMVDLINTKYSK